MIGTHSISIPSNPASRYPGYAPRYVTQLISLCNKFTFIKKQPALAVLYRLYKRSLIAIWRLTFEGSIMLTILKVVMIACILLATPSPNFALETYLPKKVVLGKYDKLTRSFGTYNVPWIDVRATHVAVDDHRNIYVLDRQSKRVLLFSQQGKLIKEINLSAVDFSDKSDELGDEGYIEYQLEVSSDGKFIYVTEGGKENNWAVLHNNGSIIKRNISLKWLKRKCGDRFEADSGAIEVDNKLNLIKKLDFIDEKEKRRVIDSEDNVYYLNLDDRSSNKVILTKLDVNRKQIFRKVVLNYSKPLVFIGIDGKNNIYMVVDSPRNILKVNSDGTIQDKIAIPADPFFKGWNKCKVLCDGTIFCTPDYSALWHANKENPIGEYLIYFFEKK